MKKKLVISTGAGISAESGIKTFRDADGLWENYDVMEVASADGFRRNPGLIHKFYNDRRRQLIDALPNAGHLGLVDLEKDYDVYIITQNVDNLHEKAGSKHILHLHGELMKVRALDDETKVYELHPSGPFFETTPDTVIAGHHVPAVELVWEADIFVVIGTSLNVYPAAGLLHYVRPGVPVYYIDPNPASVPAGVTVIPLPATQGVARLASLLRQGDAQDK